MCERGNREDGGGEEGQRRDRPCARRVEPLDAVSKAPGEEGQPEHEQTVGEDRADQRRLDDANETSVEREQGDEKLGEVAERRLHRACGSGPESASELLGRRPDEAREDSKRTCGCYEAQDRIEIRVVERAGDRD